ncbi:MAG: ABC transporter ATP-binding protein [Gammaproteobacteria bacterium]|nr:ABC transporter ATP-binding protein [Gammaproteobacteria bacterium]
MSDALLELKDISVHYRQAEGRGSLTAVDRVSLSLAAGRTLGIVGESGCGKSSLARAILQLEDHVGETRLAGEALESLSPNMLREARSAMQAVFQDPLASLNPRRRVLDIVSEPLSIHRREMSEQERAEKAAELLKRTGIGKDLHLRYPHELSGGQCQRVAIARAFVCEPRLVICDEPVSALDMSVRGQILSLLATLQRDLGIALIFIAHDMSAVRYLCEEVVVMLAGEVVEQADRETLFERPAHPYTRQLLNAVLPPDPTQQPPPLPRRGDHRVPDKGCVFAPRCPWVQDACREELPELRRVGGGLVACRRAEEI